MFVRSNHDYEWCINAVKSKGKKVCELHEVAYIFCILIFINNLEFEMFNVFQTNEYEYLHIYVEERKDFNHKIHYILIWSFWQSA